MNPLFSAACQSGKKLFSEYDQEQKYYPYKNEVIHKEIPPEQYADLIRDYCREFFVSKGLIIVRHLRNSG